MTIAAPKEIVLGLMKLREKIMRVQDDEKFRQFGWDLIDLAADVAGVPEDNTATCGACDVANETGAWPFWGYCRDSLHEEVMKYEHDLDRQAAIVMAWPEYSRQTMLDK